MSVLPREPRRNIEEGQYIRREKEEEETPLPQLNVPLDTPQSPFDDFIVKLLVLPESVNVARV